MSKNIAHPGGPQYGSGRRNDSPNGIKLPSDFLTNAWNREIDNIGRNLSIPMIQQHVARATGFAWGLRAADLINEDMHKAMGEAIGLAEQAALVRFERGSDERD
ncbi:hypothetical protein [Pseudomonas tolaasii]|uniref:hypothetical protein n=1 Tax=Pseudomonas tolaasii TaxID=29442 RepID=UPI0015A05A80|nr:hypothetical protein [Pseudomonas tolaasii]NVZ45542.1 hypothetical protein [Pseudomonas tolaasii]NWA52436.1 hypothetical protein [Pseudomonas tolaasii]QXQ16602.1 hypothetical protein I7845_16995 [Pseudomonas tolaasii]